jgi:hypothetical protein
VEDHDRRSCHRRPLTWRFSRVFPGPQHTGIPCRNARYRSRTEEARGSNPLTSTPTSQVRASSASSWRRSPPVAAAPRPQAHVAVQLGRLAATRRLGPGPSTVTTERGHRLQPERASAATPDSPEQKPPWLRPMACRSRIRRDGQTRALLAVWLPAAPTRSMKSPVQTPRTRTRTRGHPTPGHRDVHTRTLDSGCVDTRGHRTVTRTPDTGRVDAWTRPSTRTGPPRHGGTGHWAAEPWTCGRRLRRPATTRVRRR